MAAERSDTVGDLGDELEAHRAALVAHCYRLLGSYHDAEEATQEAMLRAWRGRAGFRGDAALGTWLYRIATRVCLDSLRGRTSRPTPLQLASASDPASPPSQPTPEVGWLEPIPTASLPDAAPDPAAAYSLAESVKLAFIAALQTLPPRQRAVLILRDVLAWRAAEVADTLEMSVAAVNSALERARQRLRGTVHAGGVDAFVGSEPDDPAVVRILDAYVRAWQRDDVDALIHTLREDVRLAMPPVPSWYAGRGDVLAFLRDRVFLHGGFELVPTHANAQPAFVLFGRAPDGARQAIGVQVLTIDAGGISAIDSFMDPSLTGPFTRST